MQSVGVVVDPPFFDGLARLVEVGEQVLVEALLTQSAVEALDESILHRFARCDVVPFDTAFLLPSQDGIRGRLGAVVADDHAGMTALFGDPIEFTGNTQAGERGVHHQAHAFVKSSTSVRMRKRRPLTSVSATN